MVVESFLVTAGNDQHLIHQIQERLGREDFLFRVYIRYVFNDFDAKRHCWSSETDLLKSYDEKEQNLIH